MTLLLLVAMHLLVAAPCLRLWPLLGWKSHVHRVLRNGVQSHPHPRGPPFWGAILGLSSSNVAQIKKFIYIYIQYDIRSIFQRKLKKGRGNHSLLVQMVRGLCAVHWRLATMGEGLTQGLAAEASSASGSAGLPCVA